MSAIVVLTVATQRYIAIGIVIEYFIHSVSLALTRSLTKIKGFEGSRSVTEQCVAQHKHVVNLLVAACCKAGAESTLPLVCTLYGIHTRCPGLYPYELPVVVKVI